MEESEPLGLRLGRAGYSKAYSWPSPAGRKKKAQRFNAGNKRPRRRVLSGTTEAHDRGAILSSLLDLACLRNGVPALKRWAVLACLRRRVPRRGRQARPFGTETMAITASHTNTQ